MAHRHYGLRETKPPATDMGQAPVGALSSGAILGGIVVVFITLGLAIYGLSRTVADAVNTSASAPHTTGQPTPGPTGAPSGLRGRAESFSIG